MGCLVLRALSLQLAPAGRIDFVCELNTALDRDSLFLEGSR